MTGGAVQYFAAGLKFPRGEWALAGAYPYYKTYETKDGKLISLGCLEPWSWEDPGIAIKLSDTPGKVRRLASYSGEHTDEVLLSAGYTKSYLEKLRQTNAIG